MSRIVTLVAVAVSLVQVAWAEDPKGPSLKLVTYKVKRESLQPMIVERGSIEAATNGSITCTLKSGSKTSTIASTIKYVVDDGAVVKKGDLLIELDDAGLLDQLKSQKITLDAAEADKAQAEEQLKITLSQNESDLESAKATLRLAELDLEKYLKSDVEQLRLDIKSRLREAEADVEQRKYVLEQAEDNFKEKKATEGVVRYARLRVEAAQLTFDRVKVEQHSFEKYQKPRTESDLRGKVAQAQRALATVKIQAAAKEALAQNHRDVKRAVHQQQLAAYRDLEAEIRKCKILAPQDGMVLYHVPEQQRGGPQTPLIAQGEPVREGQRLLYFPDLSKLHIRVGVSETLVRRLRVGAAADVRIDAFPDRLLRGKVSQVATLPSMREWFTSDEKVYTTVIALDDKTDELRPGMTGTVVIDYGKSLDEVLTIPARAVIGRPTAGKKTSCLVLTADGPTEREIVIGARNERNVVVTEGLRTDDEVIVNPAVLLNALRDRIRFLRGRP
jgi:multidrug efflux pump subunit AcrA (membrane-fusion protein)